MRFLFIIAFIMTFATILLGSTKALANPVATSALNTLYGCVEITNDIERLACLDRNLAELRSKEENKEIITIDAKTAKSIQREAFGFSLPTLPKLGLPSFGDDNNKGSDVLTLNVKSVDKRGSKYVFHMENGQIWQQTGGRFNYIPRGDLAATIKSGALGSYKISLSNGNERVRGMKVKRTE